MAKEKEDKKDEAAEGTDLVEGGAKPKKKLAGKQLILFIVLPAILLLGGGGAAAYFFVFKKKPEVHADAKGGKDEHGKDKKDDGHGKKDDHGKDKKDKKGDHGGDKKGETKDGKGEMKISEGPNGEAFMTLPDMLVNITSAGDRPQYLKLRVTLQAKDAEVAEAIKPALPRILDQFTGFLRELRTDEVSGSAGYARLQLELLKRVNLAVAPAQIDAVMIEEMLVQ